MMMLCLFTNLLKSVLFWQISYLVLLGLYSYFMTVQLRPGNPSIQEILVWVWALTLWLEEIRQVVHDSCRAKDLVYL